MKRLLPFVIAALVIPSVALAKGKPPKPGKSAPKVQYIFKGTLSGYTAYDSSTSTNGSITILVKHSNRHGKALKGQTLTFTGEVTVSTKVRLHHGVATGISGTGGDRGVVKLRAPKRIDPSALMSTLESTPVRQVIDQGHAKS
jgi:hypothetical protein